MSNKSDNLICEVQQSVSRAPWDYIVRSISTIVLAVCPAVICACIAQDLAGWRLFERSGSIITIIGLLLASRRYFEQRVTELVAQTKGHTEPEPGEVLNRILDARRGLTLSAFGTLIWGWGLYLRWWSFAVLALWLAFVIYRAFYDPVLQYHRGVVSPAGASDRRSDDFGETSEPDEDCDCTTLFASIDSDAS